MTDTIDLTAELEKALAEESSDAEKYMNFAGAAEEKYPQCGYASILRDIAHEEMIHHKHIREILQDMKKKEMKSKWM